MSADSASNFLVSARKYRPTTWETVVGQKSITDTLRHSIETGKIAQAYLFCGPRGVGKTTCARIFANTINGFTQEQAERSFNVFELDAASNNGVDQIRSIIDQVRIPPQDGRYKVYVIDEVHMLSKDAFNAFLKTLEEPPPHAVFILATTEKHKILPTILSRCQIYDFRRITTSDIAAHLKYVAEQEQVETDDEALNVIAQRADGAMRDALSIFDQLVASSNGKVHYANVTKHLNVLGHDVYFGLLDACLDGEIGSALLALDRVLAEGFDGHHFITGLGHHVRTLLVSKDEATWKLMESSPTVADQFKAQTEKCSLHFLVGAIEAVNRADQQYRMSRHQRLLIELLVMQIGSLDAAAADGAKKK
jgi:DNA polymerase-3 subunit gamma/tau